MILWKVKAPSSPQTVSPSTLETYQAILLFLCGLAITVVTTPLVIRLCSSGGWGVDKPDQFRKSHDGLVPRLGGLPIFGSLLISFGCAQYFEPEFLSEWWPLILCNLLIFTTGFVDDLKPLGAKFKFISQIGIALLAYSLGLRIELLSSPLSDLSINLGGYSLFATLLWLVALPNIINLIDGMDGLASGVGMFLCLTLGVMGIVGGQMEVAVVSLAMAGALLGFLLFNFPPARIFLGDGGAYLIGFFIGSVSLTGSNKGSIAAALLVVLVALGLPILDTLFAIIRRAVRGLPLFRADAEHIHHRLIVLGFSKNTALITMYAVCVVLSSIGVSIFWSKGQTLPIAGAAFFLLTLVAARYLGYVRNWGQLRGQFERVLSYRKDVQYASLLSKLLEVEMDRTDDAAAHWELFDVTLERVGLISASRANSEEIRNGSLKRIEIPLGKQASWVLYHAADEKDEGYWERLADCFHPAYSGALAHWETTPRPGEVINCLSEEESGRDPDNFINDPEPARPELAD